MRLTKDLRFVSKIDTIAHGIVHFYTAQISRDVFEQFFAELGDVVGYVTNLSNPADLVRVAPQLAYPALKRAAIHRGTWATARDDKGNKVGPVGVEDGLIAEFERLTTIAYAGPDGQRQIPLQMAIANGILDDDDRAEILSEITFFSAVSRAAASGLRDSLLESTGKFRGWVYTSESFTAALASLKASTAPASTTKKASSVIA